MLRRVLAALVAVVLAVVGIWLVISYANNADERALAGLETEPVVVATGPIPRGTDSTEMQELIEVQDVPVRYQLDDVFSEISDLEGLVAARDIAIGEQLRRAVLVTPEQLRARGTFTLPAEAQDLHQLTVPLENPRALGGSIAPGDLVGIFGSFDIEAVEGFTLDADGRLVRDPEAAAQGDVEDEGGGGASSLQFTDLLLSKVLVVRVEGGQVVQPGAEDEEDQSPADTLNVTLALEAQEAARVIYAVEHGLVWLTLQPDSSSDEPIEVIVGTLPDRARSVLE